MAQILALVDDLFFQTKMAETAKQLGVEMKSFSAAEALLAEWRRERPMFAVVDLNARQSPWPCIARLRAEDSSARILAFFSHVQTDLAERAIAAGCTEVMPRSKFTKELANIFARAKV